jgi:coniferyl-aldehyde dehydrogenase
MASERNGNGGGGGGEGHAENGNGKGGAVSFKMPEIRFTKLFINGSFVDAVSGTFRLSPLSYTHLSS